MEIGVLLLIAQLFDVGIQNVPLVTMLVIAGQVGLYMGFVPVTWDAVTACLSAQAVLKWREYERLLLSALEHADDTHLYYNMLSFLVKGKSLERRFGSPYFAYILVVFTVLTNVIYVALQVLFSELLNDRQYYKVCAIGFSGVIFALKVLTTHYSERGYQRFFGIRFSNRYAVWIELLAIQLMVPNASFTGHLAGIIVGGLYTQGPLKLLMDLPIRVFSYFFHHRETQRTENSSRHTNWGSGVSGRSEPSHSADAEYDEAVRRSYETLQEEMETDESVAESTADFATVEEYDEAVQRGLESLRVNPASENVPTDFSEMRRRRLARFSDDRYPSIY